MNKLPVGISLLLFLLMCLCWIFGVVGFVAMVYAEVPFGQMLITTVFCLISCVIGWWLNEKLKDWA